jgi:E3 ubiquitin-protein ligase BAH
MKFGHAFQEALAAESYPQHWVEKAIPYRQLKKILGKVREELIKKGYSPDTLHQLLADHNAEYRLETDASHLLRPRLVVRPSLSLQHAAETGFLSESHSGPDGADATHLPEPGQAHEDHETDEWVKIPLNSDARFFGLLQTDVTQLDTLQDEERQSMNDKIKNLGTGIAGVAKPRKGVLNLSKSDLYRWREIFELYLAAQVFFSTYEVAGGLRKSEKAQKQLVWFQDEINKRQLPQKFKLESSAIAYAQFLALNATLLQNLQFQELNQTAVTKIIKSERSLTTYLRA